MEILNNSKTAILLFSRNAEEEAVAKKLSPHNSSNSNNKIAQLLIDNTISEISKTRIPYFIVGSKKQFGVNFGEKLTNSILSIIQKGYDSIIVIGNDCPQLHAHDITIAANLLQKNETVLGATSKGGLYLIGISKNSFNPTSFSQLPWETINIAKAFLNLTIENNISFSVLVNKSDINNYYDLTYYLQNIHFAFTLIKKLQSIFASLSKEFNSIDYNLFLRLHRRYLSLRAPPTF